jgi:hypothetical protein
MQDVCAASALLNRGGAAALDLFGVIPGEGNLLSFAQLTASSTSFGLALASSPNGTISNGAALGGTGYVAGGASTLINGLRSTGSGPIATAFASIGKVLPAIGNVVSAISFLNDVIGKDGISDYYNQCLAGKN